jgi:hypothetical protein
MAAEQKKHALKPLPANRHQAGRERRRYGREGSGPCCAPGNRRLTRAAGANRSRRRPRPHRFRRQHLSRDYRRERVWNLRKVAGDKARSRVDLLLPI